MKRSFGKIAVVHLVHRNPTHYAFRAPQAAVSASWLLKKRQFFADGEPQVIVMPTARKAALFVIILMSLLSLAASGAALNAFGQSSSDEVHVVPRRSNAVPDQDGKVIDSDTATIRKAVDLVLVPVTITDSMNRLVTGLDQRYFQVFEGKQRQEIKHFSSEDAPASVGIVFDVSGSMKDKMERAREAVLEFCKAGNPQDEFFMITFADRPNLESGFTPRVEEIQSKLATTSARGRTALLDAIYLAINQMREAAYPRKALLIISDGGDNHSRYSVPEVTSVVKESDVMVYAIGTFDRQFLSIEELNGPELLNTLAGVTGGRAFSIENPNDLPAVASWIGRQLRHQYVLAYRPQNARHDGKWHKIRVKLG